MEAKSPPVQGKRIEACLASSRLCRGNRKGAGVIHAESERSKNVLKTLDIRDTCDMVGSEFSDGTGTRNNDQKTLEMGKSIISLDRSFNF
jgi:hypothetical protein